ncbi:M56 family metallopeptidase [Novipirellula artificiosorum]|uniref:BlaR1 peptidase M56 n=1 Tax=Novipirellula artificiosorum TaxID=2528016 RepID=A0A5C6DVY5_9BACT|nr:M56 family metallopeptidase [Novipirellula artificiosorum]TWU39216.1 BlaR1 peptidase M56 [Novipirellula artificiosorum]
MNYLQNIVAAQLVQLSIVALVAWFLADTVFRRRPRMQFAVWSVVLLKCIVPPLMPSLIWPTALSGPGAWSNHKNLTPVLTQAEASIVTTTSVNAADHRPRTPRHNSSPSLFTLNSFSGCAAAVWFVGAMTVFALIILQIRRTRLRLRRRWPRRIDQLESAFDQVQFRFGGQARRTSKVRLIVTRGCFGPAAMHPTHPLIAMPGKLAERLSSQQLRPLLAHEIMHVRRGDLWLGWLQTVAVWLNWFHPLVWLASRRLSVAIEQCCDEDTVRLLQCDPADYRQGLLTTVLWKNSVPTLPVASAIRPAHLTLYRMEALMKIDLSRPTQPWKCRLLWLLMIVLLLPGARWSVSASPDKPKPTEPISQEDKASVLPTGGSESEIEISAEDTRVYPRTYRVSDLLTVKQSVLESPYAARLSITSFTNFEPLMTELTEKVAPETWESAGGAGTMGPYHQNLSLVISTTWSVHDEIVDYLTEKRQKLGKTQVVPAAPANDQSRGDLIELRSSILQGAWADLQDVNRDWKPIDDTSEATFFISDLTSTLEPNRPLRVRWAVVEAAAVERIAASKGNRGTVHVVSRPTVRMKSHTTASISVGNEQEIKFRKENGERVDERLWTGIRMELTAATKRSASGDPLTSISMKFSSQERLSVEPELNGKADGQANAGSYPVLEARALTIDQDLPSGKALLVLQSSGDDDQRSSLLIISRNE